MASERQKEATRENIKKAQQKWQEMTPEEHAAAQPEGESREKPGEGKSGKYYRIEVRPRTEFKTFRYHDVGEPGHIQRLAGQRDDGTWEDQAWLVSRKDAHIANHFLEADTDDAKNILELYGPAHQVEGNIFIGHPRKKDSEK